MSQTPWAKHAWIITAVLAAGMGWAAGCGDQIASPNEAAPETPRIVASLYPLADLTGRLMGDVAEVNALLPAGANPHDFDMTAQQVAQLAKADLLIINGLGLDDWARRAAAATGRPDLVILTFTQLAAAEDAYDHAGHDEHADHHEHELPPAPAATNHHHHDHAGPNPHLWLDPVLARRFVARLGPVLADFYPDSAQVIHRNTQRLLNDLVELDADYRRQLQAVPQKKLVTFHNSFDLLAERYGLEVVGHLTDIDLSPGGEITPQRRFEIARLISQHGLKVLYCEPQFPDRAVEGLREQTGVALLRLDPQGNPNLDGYRGYLDMMKSNLNTLVDGQSRGP